MLYESKLIILDSPGGGVNFNSSSSVAWGRACPPTPYEVVDSNEFTFVLVSEVSRNNVDWVDRSDVRKG